MEDEAEFSGRTVEDAINEAASALGLDREDLQIDVITAGSRGVFGIGAENARIRAQPKVGGIGQPGTPASELEETGITETETEPSGPSTATAVATAPRDTAQIAEEAQQVLQELLHKMGFDASVSVRTTENPIMLTVTGNNLGILIGRRGDNLAAIQFMVNLILSKHRRQWPRVVIDIENYRARREESLRGLADRIAYRVRRNQKPFTLEAMPASDRRVIHLTLRDQGDVETYSIGEGPSRRVVIAPIRGAHGSYQNEEQ